jgi:hypothetical protein
MFKNKNLFIVKVLSLSLFRYLKLLIISGVYYRADLRKVIIGGNIITLLFSLTEAVIIQLASILKSALYT